MPPTFARVLEVRDVFQVCVGMPVEASPRRRRCRRVLRHRWTLTVRSAIQSLLLQALAPTANTRIVSSETSSGLQLLTTSLRSFLILITWTLSSAEKINLGWSFADIPFFCRMTGFVVVI